MIAPLATFVDVAQNVGLPVVFLLIAIETMGIPVPGETALITAGILASRGHLTIEARHRRRRPPRRSWATTSASRIGRKLRPPRC